MTSQTHWQARKRCVEGVCGISTKIWNKLSICQKRLALRVNSALKRWTKHVNWSTLNRLSIHAQSCSLHVLVINHFSCFCFKMYEILSAHVSKADLQPPLLVCGTSGRGKSLMLAKWWEESFRFTDGSTCRWSIVFMSIQDRSEATAKQQWSRVATHCGKLTSILQRWPSHHDTTLHRSTTSGWYKFKI